MSRETKYTGIILKKQPFSEADEIITLFTKEAGKVRVFAKSVKLAKSKLNSKLQALFEVSISVANAKLPKLTAVETLEVFAALRENLQALKTAYYACELVLKFTPDEQKNENLFFLLEKFFTVLSGNISDEATETALAVFKIQILSALGFGIETNLPKNPQGQIFFVPGAGGFSQSASSAAIPVSDQAYGSFLNLKKTGFENIGLEQDETAVRDLNRLLSGFVEYQLERKMKSEKYLNQENVV